MAEVKLDVLAPRTEARNARLKLLRDAAAVPTIKVFAGSEDMRRVLRHPRTRIGFPSLSEAVEWPNDSFTVRRIREGSVRLEAAGPANGEAAPEDETKNARERAAARRPKPEGASRPEGRAPKAERAR